MHPKTCILLILLASAPVSAADSAWRLKVAGVHLTSTAGGAPDGNAGAGIGLEYRASRRVGIELGASTGEVTDKQDFDFFDVHIRLESSLEVTPVLARLNFHLTPDRRADFYVGPVAGWVRYGDLEIQARGGFTEPTDFRVPTDDAFAWGAHAGLDLPIGNHGLFLTTGLTYLKAEVKTDSEDAITGSFNLDPLVTHLGLGYQF